jgi:hypothetical protein
VVLINCRRERLTDSDRYANLTIDLVQLETLLTIPEVLERELIVE